MFSRQSLPTNLCPFSWISQKRGCGQSEDVWEPVQCLGDRCKLWDETIVDCSFNNLRHHREKSKSHKE